MTMETLKKGQMLVLPLTSHHNLLHIFIVYVNPPTPSNCSGADLGEGAGGAPSPPWDDLRFSNTTGILQKLCGLLVLK